MSTRSWLTIALLLPFIVFLWFLGWSLYWIGSNKKHRTSRKVEDAISIITAVYEEAVISERLA